MVPHLMRAPHAARLGTATRPPISMVTWTNRCILTAPCNCWRTQCAASNRPAQETSMQKPQQSSAHLLPAQTEQRQQKQQQTQQQQERQQHQNQVQERSLSAALCLVAGATLPALLAAGGAHAASQPLAALAELDAASAHALESGLRPLFAAFTVLYIIRIPMTWYPSIDGGKLPWLLAYAPTEPFLRATRAVVPLVGGVDVTPIVWVGLISFLNEILLGPQGILMLIQRQGV